MGHTHSPGLAGRFSSSATTPKQRRNSNISSRSTNAVLSRLCICSMRPRQRAPPADHSRQRRMTNVLTGGTGDDSVIRCQHITEVSKRSQIILSIDPFALKPSHNRPARRPVSEEVCLRTLPLFRVTASSTSCEQRSASASGQSIQRTPRSPGIRGSRLPLAFRPQAAPPLSPTTSAAR